MYSANYGYGNAAPNFNPGGAPQPGMQPNQQVMFNRQQQFAGMAPQGNFPGANPHMMPDGSAGMMHQNPGMPNMAPNSQMAAYQQQFPGAPYGQVLPPSVNPQNFAPNNYMMGPGMQGYPMGQPGMGQPGMGQPGMPQQPQMMQRMQPQQQNHVMNQVSTPQRPPSAAQGTSTNVMPPHQPQFSPPQPMSQGQTPTNSHQQVGGGAAPQTPTFSSNLSGSMSAPSSATAPLSPKTEAREKERFALLLDINHELLYESIQIQSTQQELKKEFAALNGNIPDRKPTEEEGLFQQDYLQCMRRLQANLSYMAALADRKPEVKVPPCPAYLSPPPLNLSLRLRATPIGAENSNTPADPVADREERDRSIKDLYRRLQAVFPGFDLKKEPAFRMPGAGQKPGNLAMANQASPTSQRTPQLSHMPGPPMNAGGMSMQ